jgi:hypothetical protein
VEYGSDDGRRARVFLPRPPAGPGPTIVLPPRAPEEADAEPRKPAPDFPAATLTVLLPDGRPAAGAEVGTECVKGWWHGEFGGCLDDEGRTERDFDRGDRLRVTADPYGDDGGTVLPLTARIEGPGPWTIRWPTAEVVVRAVDESGAALPEFTVFLDTGQAPAAEEGAVRILGAGAGPLRLWVDAPGRRPHDLRLVLADGERREVVVRMNGDSAPGVSTRSPGPDLPRVAVADPPSRLALDRHAVDPLDQLPVPRPAAPDRQLERRAIRSHRQLELHRLPRGGRVHSPVLGDHGLSHLDSRGHSPFGPAYPVGTMPSNAR